MFSNLVVLGQGSDYVDKLFEKADLQFVKFNSRESKYNENSNDSCYIITTGSDTYFNNYNNCSQKVNCNLYSKIHSKWTEGKSINKIDYNFEYNWRIFFYDRYVRTVTKTNSGNFIITGSTLSKNKIWVGEITIEGKVLWIKNYRVGPNIISYLTRVDDAAIGKNGDIIVTGVKGIIAWIRFYGRGCNLFKRIAFLQPSNSEKIFIVCFDKNGNEKSMKTFVDKKNSFGDVGVTTLKNNSILITITYADCKEKK